MAVITPTRTEDLSLVTITWASVTTADTGARVDVSDLTAKCVQVTSGGAGTAQIRASIDGTNFVGLTAALINGTAAPMPVGMAEFTLNSRAVDISAVAGATSTITLIGTKRRPL